MLSRPSQNTIPATGYFTIIAMVSPIALNILLPSLPDVATDLNVTYNEIQLSLTLYLFALAIGQLICGPLADRFGRRPILLVGIIIHFIGCLVGVFSDSLNDLLLARVLQALGGCTGMVLARTIILDCYSRDQAAGKIGYITFAIALSQAIAPTLGGHINLQLGWQYLFHFSLLLSTVSWCIVLVMIPETIKNKTRSLRLTAIFKQYIATLKTPDYLAYCISTTFIACAFYLFIGSVPYIVRHELHGSSADFGNWFLWVSFGFMAGSFIASQLSSRLGIDKMILFGHTLSLSASLMMFLLVLFYGVLYSVLFLPMAFLTLGRGISQPNAQAAAISSVRTTPGTASGLMGFIQLMAGAITVQMTPLLLSYGTVWIFLAICLCTVASLCTFGATK